MRWIKYIFLKSPINLNLTLYIYILSQMKAINIWNSSMAYDKLENVYISLYESDFHLSAKKAVGVSSRKFVANNAQSLAEQHYYT